MRSDDDVIAFERPVDYSSTGSNPPRFMGAQFVHPHVPGPAHPSNPPQVQQQAQLPGLVERWLVPGEGVCFGSVTLFFPPSIVDTTTPRKPMPAVVWYQKEEISASAPPAGVSNLTSQGYVVAFPELCGFGSVGPAFSPELSGTGQAAEDMAHEIGRSVPGFHAGGVYRFSHFLNGRTDVSAIKLIVAQDYIDVAVLHAILAEPGIAPPQLALLRPAASLAAAALNRFYATGNYYSWIVGIVKAYDLADCIAAITNGSPGVEVLVVGPVDETLTPLADGAASAAYAFASRVSPAGALRVEPGTFSDAMAADMVLRFLKKP